MDLFSIGLLVALWLCTVVLAYGTGWVKGFDTCEENHRWSRWLLRQYANRSIRF
jgi:hypothetical protein